MKSVSFQAGALLRTHRPPPADRIGLLAKQANHHSYQQHSTYHIKNDVIRRDIVDMRIVS